MSRISVDEYFMELAIAASKRATCPKKQVGCVIANKHGHLIASGYNGVPKGFMHCIDIHCGDNPCYATHAEANALLQCTNINDVHKVYCTLAPCFDCAKLIANTSVREVIYLEAKRPEGLALLESLGITVKCLTSRIK